LFKSSARLLALRVWRTVLYVYSINIYGVPRAGLVRQWYLPPAKHEESAVYHPRGTPELLVCVRRCACVHTAGSPLWDGQPLPPPPYLYTASQHRLELSPRAQYVPVHKATSQNAMPTGARPPSIARASRYADSASLCWPTWVHVGSTKSYKTCDGNRGVCMAGALWWYVGRHVGSTRAAPTLASASPSATG
jgi:hypothetical protein